MRPTSLATSSSDTRGSVLTLDLPAGKDKPSTLEDQVHFCSPGRSSAQARRDIGQVDEPHEFEGKCLKCEASGMDILSIQALDGLS